MSPQDPKKRHRLSPNNTRDPTILSQTTKLQRPLCEFLEIQFAMIFRHVLSARDTVNLHMRVVFQIRQQLGRDEEVLCGVGAARNVDDPRMNHTGCKNVSLAFL